MVRTEKKKNKKFEYFNREISWLVFNERVLQEAANREVPLIERIRFLAIFSSNLDDFFRVRVAIQRRFLELPKLAEKEITFSPRLTLELIHQKTVKLSKKFDQIYFEQIIPALREHKVFILDEKELKPRVKDEIEEIFVDQIQPHLNPIMLGYTNSFPNLKDGDLYFAIRLERTDFSIEYALVRLPKHLPRFFMLKERKGKQYVIMLDDIIRQGLPMLFSLFPHRTISAYTVKITRDAGLDLDYDFPEPLLKKVNKSLKKRNKGFPVRFIYDQSMPKPMLRYFTLNLKLKNYNSFPGGRYHNFSDFFQFPRLEGSKLYYESMPALRLKSLDKAKNILSVIAKQDILLHHPYHSYDYVIRFLRESAIDPHVTSIRICLYRLSDVSSIVNNLITARMNGKSVKVIIELQARFDEQANINWTEVMTDAGIDVYHGIDNKKTHAKMALVSRLESGVQKLYAHLGTGNYNENTAKMYCDDSLLTADETITYEVYKVFNEILLGKISASYRELLVAPTTMRTRFEDLLKAEIKSAKKEMKAYVILKMNSLTDEDMIHNLYEASRAGVKIQLIVRGICCLIPGVKGMSENIEVFSIVDRFLEHSRIYVFGGSGAEKMYLSSADWMTRNLKNRVEVAFPIKNAKHQKQIKQILEIQLSDNVKSRKMKNPLRNSYNRKGRKDVKIQAQNAIYDLLKKKKDSTI